MPGLVVQVAKRPDLGIATTDANGVLDAFPCESDDPCELDVRLAAVPLAHYGEEIRAIVRPTTLDEPSPDVVLQHGPRVIVDTLLPGGTVASDFVVEFLHEPSLLSSQMGHLGGCAALYEGPRGPWAWSPPITNGVRGEGGTARILSRDGLWASPRVRVTDAERRPIERRIESHDEVYVRSSLMPAGVVHLRVAPPHDRAQLMLMPDIEGGLGGRTGPFPEDTLVQIPTPGAIDSSGLHRFHWLAPGAWRVGAAFGNQTATPSLVTALAGQIVDVDVTMRDP